MRISYLPFRVLFLFLVPCTMLLHVQAQQQSGAAQSFKFTNTSLPIDQRVDDLIGRMTLEEKVSQMRDHAPAIQRLGVPKYDWWNEGLHGVAFAGYATNFPQVIGMAATWDTNLVHRMGETISTEARAKYNQAMREDHHEMFFGLTFWAPNINIFRDPRWGRGQETYGEDPFLTGRMGVAFVTGIQGDDPKYLKLISTPKHYAVHSGPEPLRHQFNVDVSPHDLEDTYLPAFRATITELPPAPTRSFCAITCVTRGTLKAMSSVTALPSPMSIPATTSPRIWPTRPRLPSRPALISSAASAKDRRTRL
jgi:beta-glucosidase